MTTTAEERGDLIEEMLPVAAHLACIVRGDGGPEDVEAALDELTRYEQKALIVALAGLVNPGTPLSDALGYLTWDEYGNPAPPVQRDHRTIRTLATRYRTRRRRPPYVDMARVMRRLRGEPLHLSAAERNAAIEYGIRRMGQRYDTLADLLDMEKPNLLRTWERIKKRARRAGEGWPNTPQYTTEPLLEAASRRWAA